LVLRGGNLILRWQNRFLKIVGRLCFRETMEVGSLTKERYVKIAEGYKGWIQT